MDLITVIVPVYNTEKYLEKCLNSIINQTYQQLDIILIDDGSHDNSGKICDAYAEKDNRIRVFHQPNKGVSAARNKGLDEARGKYIASVDSDDYVDLDMIEYLYTNIQKYDADVATCSKYQIFANRSEGNGKKGEVYVCDAEETFRRMLLNEGVGFSMSDKMVKRDLIEGFRYEEGKIHEDCFFIALWIEKVNKVVISTVDKYHYIHRAGSITTKFKKENMYLIEANYVFKHIVDTYFPRLDKEMFFRLAWTHAQLLDLLFLDGNFEGGPEYQILVRFFRKNIIKTIKNPYISSKRKMAMVIFQVSIPLYKKLSLKQWEKSQWVN